MWYYNDNTIYSYQQGSTEGWKLFADLFPSRKSSKYAFGEDCEMPMVAEGEIIESDN